jgi:VRR-NUC domain-containing protein
MMSGARHRRQRPEAAIHAAVCDHLRLRAKPRVLWLHPANGERRDAITGAKLKRMGVLAGASDLLLFRPGACPHCGSARLEGFALELKSDGGRLTDAQREFLWRFSEVGGHTCVAEGLDRALAVLEQWEILRGRVMKDTSTAQDKPPARNFGDET